MAGARVVSQRLELAGSGSAGTQGGPGAPQPDWKQLRPRSIGELIDQSFAVYVSHFGYFVGFAVLCFVPMHLGFDALIKPLFLQSEFELLQITMLRDMVPAVLTTGLVTFALGDELLGKQRSFGLQCWRAFLKLPSLITFYLVRLLTTVLFCCLLVLPGLLSTWFLAPAFAVYLLEGPELVGEQKRAGGSWFPLRGMILSLRRSFRLSWSWESLGRFLGVVLIGTLIISLPLTGIGALQDSTSLRSALLSSGFFDPRSAQLVMVLLGAVAMAAGAVFFDIFFTLFYFDLRVRHEAFDLERELDSLVERKAHR